MSPIECSSACGDSSWSSAPGFFIGVAGRRTRRKRCRSSLTVAHEGLVMLAGLRPYPRLGEWTGFSRGVDPSRKTPSTELIPFVAQRLVPRAGTESVESKPDFPKPRFCLMFSAPRGNVHMATDNAHVRRDKPAWSKE